MLYIFFIGIYVLIILSGPVAVLLIMTDFLLYF